MPYTLTALTTVQECDTLLAIANKDKKDLEFKKLSLERQRESYADNSVEINTELTAVNAELDAVNSILAILPDGTAKEEQADKKVKLEYKVFLLQNRREGYGTVALLDKEFNIARVDLELQETDSFITQIEAHKLTIN